MCPDPVLLTAYLDGTLFSRDVDAVDRHVSACSRCAALFAAMRQERAPQPSRWHRWRLGVAIPVGVSAGIGALAALPGAQGTSYGELWPHSDADSITQSAGATASSGPAVNPPSADRLTSSVPAERPAPAPGERVQVPVRGAERAKPVAATVKASRAPAIRSREATRRASAVALDPGTPSVTEAVRARAAGAPAHADAGIPLCGRRGSARFLWRVRDRVVEFSTDQGGTWATQYTADRTIRAGVFVNANVAWFVGEDGLILRRTVNGWFGATPPIEGAGDITGVRASSPARATITLEDGRVFSTENGGVTWLPQQVPDPVPAQGCAASF